MHVISRLLHAVGVARTLPPLVAATRILRRAGVDNALTRRIDFLHSPDTKRPTKAVEILLRSVRQAGLTAVPLAAALRDGVFLEIGCGRHAGFAPFAVGLGARQYIGVDPALDPDLLAHASVRRRYLEPALSEAKTLTATLPVFCDLPFGPTGVAGVEALLARAQFVVGGISDLGETHERVDACVSISCLEHILDFAGAARTMAAISGPDTIHIHLVNFSNHLSKRQPFSHLYEMPYEEFGLRWQHNVNGLRVSDMTCELEAAGLSLRAIPLDVVASALPARLDATWLDRYDRGELSIRTALFTNC